MWVFNSGNKPFIWPENRQELDSYQTGKSTMPFTFISFFSQPTPEVFQVFQFLEQKYDYESNFYPKYENLELVSERITFFKCNYSGFYISTTWARRYIWNLNISATAKPSVSLSEKYKVLLRRL